MALARTLRLEIADFESEQLTESMASGRSAFALADGDGDGVLDVADVARFLKTSETRAAKVLGKFGESASGALTYEALLPRTMSGAAGTEATVNGANFDVQLKAALRDVVAEEREATRNDGTKIDATMMREAAKVEYALVQTKDDAATRAIAAAALLLPLFDATSEYGGHLLATALHSGNPALSMLATTLAQSTALFGALPFSYFAAYFVLQGAAADPSKPELVRVAARTAILADIALQIPKLAFAAAVFGATIFGAANGADALAMTLDPAAANPALAALTQLDLTTFNDAMALLSLFGVAYAGASNLAGSKASIPILSKAAQDYVDQRTPDFDLHDDGSDDGPQPSF